MTSLPVSIEHEHERMLDQITSLKQKERELMDLALDRLQYLSVLSPLGKDKTEELLAHPQLLKSLLDDNTKIISDTALLTKQLENILDEGQKAALDKFAQQKKLKRSVSFVHSSSSILRTKLSPPSGGGGESRKKLNQVPSPTSTSNSTIRRCNRKEIKTAINTPPTEAELLHRFPSDRGIIANAYRFPVQPQPRADGVPTITRQMVEEHNFKTLLRAVYARLQVPCYRTLGPVLHWRTVPVGTRSAQLLSGPEDSTHHDKSWEDKAAGDSISLYPHCAGRPYREGDPICDRYQIKLKPNATIVCVTDGCNWGDKPRRASRKANKALVHYVENRLSTVQTIRDALDLLVAALANAHLSVIEGPEEQWLGGKTTANIGLLLKVDEEWLESHIVEELQSISHTDYQNTIVPSSWVFLCVNLGDCQVLHFRPHGPARHLMSIVRSEMLDPTDPGGRLGPCDGSWPDLRNLAAFWDVVDEGDVIASMSDGVYDNLDPQILGINPQQLGAQENSWAACPEEWTKEAKMTFISHFAHFLVSQNGNELTPRRVREALLSNAWQLTTKTRDFLAKNPSSKMESDYDEYPGKVDHATIACVQVGWRGPRTFTPTVSLSEQEKWISLRNGRSVPRTPPLCLRSPCSAAIEATKPRDSRAHLADWVRGTGRSSAPTWKTSTNPYLARAHSDAANRRGFLRRPPEDEEHEN